jgi:hypothetical protein
LEKGHIVQKEALAELKKEVIREITINGFGPYRKAAIIARMTRTKANLRRR